MPKTQKRTCPFANGLLGIAFQKRDFFHAPEKKGTCPFFFGLLMHWVYIYKDAQPPEYYPLFRTSHTKLNVVLSKPHTKVNLVVLQCSLAQIPIINCSIKHLLDMLIRSCFTMQILRFAKQY